MSRAKKIDSIPEPTPLIEVLAAKVSDLIPDDHNLNLGTERGDYQLTQSLQSSGAGRSILIDKNGRIIAGNKTAQKFGELGSEDIVIIKTDGKKLIAVQRTDLDLDDPEARTLALADNRVGEVNLAWNPAELEALNNSGLLDADDWFKPEELAAILGSTPPEEYDPYSAKDITETEEELAAQFDGKGPKTETIICPCCGEEFQYSGNTTNK